MSCVNKVLLRMRKEVIHFTFNIHNDTMGNHIELTKIALQPSFLRTANTDIFIIKHHQVGFQLIT